MLVRVAYHEVQPFRNSLLSFRETSGVAAHERDACTIHRVSTVW
jgi:hypothetical protein